MNITIVMQPQIAANYITINVTVSAPVIESLSLDITPDSLLDIGIDLSINESKLRKRYGSPYC